MATATIDLKKFGEQIRTLRLKLGLTQEELGHRCGLNGPNISHFENGNRQPHYGMLVRLARALGVSLGEFDPK